VQSISDRIQLLTGTVKRFDSEMLLDPFKEKFNLPALPVEFGDSERVKLSVVGENL
jgi:hypothetical protein